jgi:hypothetical protein
MPVTVTKSGPGFAKLERDLERIRKSEVYVGIPAAKANRPGEPINNASLMFVLTHGSPLKHIPPTPIVEPAVEGVRKLFTPHLGAAAKAVLEQDPQTAQRELELAGTIAANAVKRYFVEGNNWPPNAPSTIKRKMGKHKITSAEDVRRNIDWGRLRGAVTYVVKTGDQ